MFNLLRLVRALFGVIFASNLLYVIQGIATLLMNLGNATFDYGHYFALLLIKIIVLAASGIAFLYLRKLINRLHEKKFGEPHPVLGLKRWSL